MSDTTKRRRDNKRLPETMDARKKVEAAYRIFETSSEGQAVLGDLCDAYYDRISFVPGDPQATAFNEGQRAVVAAIFEILEDLKSNRG